MHSVILTELGIAVFNTESRLEKSFPFEDSVTEYLSIKKKEARLNDLSAYLYSIPSSIKVSDESLLWLLKKLSTDARMMEEAELEEIQTAKLQIMIDSGFAKNTQDVLEKLRDFSLGLSAAKVTEISGTPDLHIIQAINTLDDMDRVANEFSSRLREWYGLHFPELDNIVDSINGYAHIVAGGRRDTLTKEILEDAGFQDSKIEMILLVASNSMGGDISDTNLSIIQSIAKQVISLHTLRKKLEEYVGIQMKENAPNLSAILGTSVGARMLGKAGSLQRLASMPASTIQVLGAEKALFRSLKTGTNPPKHGLLFQHAMVHGAPRWQRGKIARAIAAKAVIAARVDVYGEGLNNTLLDKLNVRIGEIGKKYENPTPKNPNADMGRQQAPQGKRRGGKDKSKRARDRRPKSKKRKRIGRR